jgi:hypothetical protein
LARRSTIALVMGAGGIWTINDQLAVFGSYNFGLTKDSPTTIALLGFSFLRTAMDQPRMPLDALELRPTS